MRTRGVIGRCLVMAAAVSLLWGGLGAEEGKTTTSDGFRSPKDPAAPTVEVRDRKDDGKERVVPVTIVTARGDSRTGSMALQFGSIEVHAAEEGTFRKRTVPFGEIESIEFTRWRGTERRKNEFTFRHWEVNIVLRDKKALRCRGTIPVLDRIHFRDSRGRRAVYSFFYDYWKDGVWKNSGKSDRSYPETNPLGDTLVKIIFIKEEMKNFLEKLLRR